MENDDELLDDYGFNYGILSTYVDRFAQRSNVVVL